MPHVSFGEVHEALGKNNTYFNVSEHHNTARGAGIEDEHRSGRHGLMAIARFLFKLLLHPWQWDSQDRIQDLLRSVRIPELHGTDSRFQ